MFCATIQATCRLQQASLQLSFPSSAPTRSIRSRRLWPSRQSRIFCAFFSTVATTRTRLWCSWSVSAYSRCWSHCCRIKLTRITLSSSPMCSSWSSVSCLIKSRLKINQKPWRQKQSKRHRRSQKQTRSRSRLIPTKMPDINTKAKSHPS